MSKVQQFAEGELVNVSIRGARVAYADDGRVQFHVGDGQGFGSIPGGFALDLPASPKIGFERVAPPEWPPQAGDIWRVGSDDDRWFAFAPVGENRVTLRPESDFRFWSTPEDLLKDRGPVALVYRDGWTPPTETTEQVDERAELVAGYRALADLIESRPELTDLPKRVTWQPNTQGQQEAWIEAVGGATRSDHPHENTIQHWAVANVRGLKIDVTWIEDLPAVQPDEPVEEDQADTDPEEAPGAPSETPEFPPGTPEYEAYAAELKTELGKFARGEEPYPYPAPLPRRPVLADVPPAPSVPLSDDDEVLARALTALEGGEQA